MRTGFILAAGSSSVVRLRVAMWSAMVLLGAAGTLAGMYLPDLARHIGLPLETAGVIFTVQLLGGLILTPAAGRLIDAIGQRVVLLGSIVLTALGLAAIPLCGGSMTAALTAIFVFGAGFDITIVATNVITVSREEQSAPALNWLNMFYGLGAISAPIVLGVSGVDFRRAYWGMAVLVAALLLSVLALLAPAPRQFSKAGTSPPPGDWRRAVFGRRIPLFFLLAAFFYLAVGFELAFSGWITTYLRQNGQASGSTSGLGLSTFWLAMVAGRILGAGLSHRLSKGRLISACAVTASAGVLILLLVGEAHTASLAAIAVVGLGIAPLFPTGLAIAGEHYPAAVGTVSGIFFAVGSLGGMTIPWLLGEVSGVAGNLAWGMSIHLLLGVLILATIAAVGFYRPGE